MITRVQTGVVLAGNLGSINPTLTNPLGLNNSAIVCVGWDGNDDNTTPSLSDGLGNTYSPLALFKNSLPPDSIASVGIWLATISNVGVPSIVFGLNSARGGAVMLEYSGLDASPLDQTDNAKAETGTTLATGGVTTTQNDELLLAAALSIGGGSTTMTAGTGYTIATQGVTSVAGQLAVEEKIVSSIASYIADISGMASGGFNALLLVTLKAAGIIPPPSSTKPVLVIME
jgi:hypothetical protein